MENGITYIVLPFMQPLYNSVMVFFSSSGSTVIGRPCILLPFGGDKGSVFNAGNIRGMTANR